MKILVVGGGGREHSLVWKIAQSPLVDKIYCAPGNAGIGLIAENVAIDANDLDSLVAFAKTYKIDLTVVGPEDPLALGIVDRFEASGLKIFGPNKMAAAIEGSKELAKELMLKYQIPTAFYQAFDQVEPAIAYIHEQGAPIVVKADGLAAGKGVVVAMDEETAITAVRNMLDGGMLGSAGNRVVIEEYLEGEEVSILAFTDGYNVVPMVSAQDHKRVFDGDLGPNTGGMGAYSPVPIYTEALASVVATTILQPTVDGLRNEGRLYKGVLYVGLMITADGPKVLEYNARFGDPETQPILMRLETDLVEIMLAVLNGCLDATAIKWRKEAAVCVVMASAGYPGSYEKGKVITGLNNGFSEMVAVFHGGTGRHNGKIITSGGRVLGVTALGHDIEEAINTAYKTVDKIAFDGAMYRKDIAYRALKK